MDDENMSRNVDLEGQQMLETFWDRQMVDVENTTPVSCLKVCLCSFIHQVFLQNEFRNQELPLARIKKIMKLDEDVKMVAAEGPVMFAKAAEIFIAELSLRAWVSTCESNRRTLTRADVATAVANYDQFDFLIDIVPRDEAKITKNRNANETVKPVPIPDLPLNSNQGFVFQLAANGSISSVSTHPLEPSGNQADRQFSLQPQQIFQLANGQTSNSSVGQNQSQPQIILASNIFGNNAGGQPALNVGQMPIALPANFQTLFTGQQAPNTSTNGPTQFIVNQQGQMIQQAFVAQPEQQPILPGPFKIVNKKSSPNQSKLVE